MKYYKLPQGFLAAGVSCGIKKNGYDLGLILFKQPYRAIGFFTTNCNVSYSVSLSKKNIKNPVSAILVNSGNANCFSHKEGYRDTEEITKKLAERLEVGEEKILFASTGIIGKKLMKKNIIKNIPKLIKNLEDNSNKFSKSILTTDTHPKVISKTINFSKKKVTITGVAKGSGMIKPNLATMLAFVLTDADINLGILKKQAKESVEKSFNAINIDAAESTNDSLFVASSKKVSLSKQEQKKFFIAFQKIMVDLARLIVKDAEGATKFVQLDIRGAKSKKEAKMIAEKISGYILFKCALYGNNPNVGRIVAVLGQAQIKLNEKDLKIKFGSLTKKDVNIIVDLNRGKCNWRIYTCDLSPEYVKINAKYN
ncbi:MAG: bifunctional glutamate N-acetyltransferase/amino-acid acetyltransferase ArgJ [Candidatus Omnitrophica bacterium]|nr:bifunctional glutamate N-acetyltransferase/amino-acid acetyltransferase ArgJ [Candidatus Omnitrophota bacterium]MCF7878193.1 bifunctional glutamate N-acetyltransferase/amino-acid acetyltransferase ArgJ [Candidatus Omnitrophota bacterium]MCF7892683.1 bifunctional glutamate N-acetyltransferase/amino-acid acetyltransferase ArgJ [Candidatus Omnitrophota bacterium]